MASDSLVWTTLSEAAVSDISAPVFKSIPIPIFVCYFSFSLFFPNVLNFVCLSSVPVIKV